MKRLYIGIVMMMAACLCEAFHLQGLSSVRQSVCASASPCCPGHVCRAYQRSDASRPVAACATSVQARPMYAPGSSAQRRMCGSAMNDIFSRRQATFRTRNQGRGMRNLDQNSFTRSNGRSRFPSQLAGGQQWGRSDPRFRIADGDFPRQDRRDRRTQFSDRSRFGSFPPSFNSRDNSNRFPVSRSAPNSRGFNSQLNTIAPVSFSQSATSFPQGQRGFNGRSFRSNVGSQSFESNTEAQPFGGNTGSQSFGSNTGSQSFGRNTGSQSFGRNVGSQSLGSNTGSQSFGSNTGSQSSGRSNTFGQDNSFLQSQPVRGQRFAEGQDILNQLSQFPSDITQGSSMTSGGQHFSDQSLELLLQQGAPQPMLVEQPAVSISPIPGPTGGQPPSEQTFGFLDLFPSGGFPQPMLVEQPAVSVSAIPGQTGGQPPSDQSLGVLDMIPPGGEPQLMLVEQPAVSVSSISEPPVSSPAIKTGTATSQQNVDLTANNNNNNNNIITNGNNAV